MSSDLLFINQVSFCEEIVYFILASLYYQTTLNERTLIVLCSLFLQKKEKKNSVRIAGIEENLDV